MDQHLKQKEVEKAQEKMNNSSNSPWFIRPEDVQKYNNIFNYFDKSKTGVLDFEEAKDAFMQTQLSDDVLEQVWGLVDTEETGEFDRKMFWIAMHILYKVKLGSKWPMSIPNVIKAWVTTYFSDQNPGQPNSQQPPNQQMNQIPNQQMNQNHNQQMPQYPNQQMNQNPNQQMMQNQQTNPQMQSNRQMNQGNPSGGKLTN